LALWMLPPGLRVALLLVGLWLAVSTDVATHSATFSFKVSVFSLAVWRSDFVLLGHGGAWKIELVVVDVLNAVNLSIFI